MNPQGAEGAKLPEPDSKLDEAARVVIDAALEDPLQPPPSRIPLPRSHKSRNFLMPVTPDGTRLTRSDVPMRKRRYSLDPGAAEYLDRRAKKLKSNASAVLSEIVIEAAQLEAQERALEELGTGVRVSEREVQRWLRKLGAA